MKAAWRVRSIRSAARIFWKRSRAKSNTARGPTSTKLTPWAAWSRPFERGYPQREIAEASYRYQLAVDRKEKIVVGGQ